MMYWLLSLILLLQGIPYPGGKARTAGGGGSAVAFGALMAQGRATGSSFTTGSITLSGSHVTIVGHLDLKDASATVSSISWSPGGTGSQIVSIRGTDALSTVWCIIAPNIGVGTITVNFSASVPYQYAILSYTGTSQTNPCPSGNAVSSTTGAGTETLTPTGTGANDGASMNCANTITDSPISVSPNQRTLDATTAVNMGTGDAFGAGVSVSCSMSSGSGGHYAYTAIRLVQG